MTTSQEIALGRDNPELRKQLFYLLGATRGGPNRAKIISFLRTRPANANQIAAHLGVQYKAARFHLDVLRKWSLVVSSEEGYAARYHLGGWLQAYFYIFEEVVQRLESGLARDRRTLHYASTINP